MSAPARIVSLVPSLTELVCELGLADHLVGRTGFCIHPAASLAAIPKVGGTKTVNIERIRRLAPTHCVVNVDENEKPTVETIATFIPNIVVTHPISVEDNFSLYRQFGDLFGAQSAAERLCARLEAVLERVDARRFAPIEVAYLIWNDPWMTVSPDTFIARMLARVGLIAYTPAAGERYPTVSAEALAGSAVKALLLSSEPCRFRASDRAHLRASWTRRGLDPPLALGIDGEMTSWYGPRAIRGLDYLLAYRDRLEARLVRRDRPRARGLGPAVTSLVACGLVAGIVAGCATPSPPAESSGSMVGQAGQAGVAAATPGRSGRFYLDDGPGDRPLAELEKIPDAIPKPEPLHRFANRPYTQFGRYYEPMTRLEPFRERGIATWYGKRYHNRPTSTGERYDMYAMTAAHPTLPLPSYARVTHVRSGRSIVVRINDRGPFVPGRVIDLSYAAAARLGTALSGSAEVEVEAITRFDAQGIADASNPPANAVSAVTAPGVAPAGAGTSAVATSGGVGVQAVALALEQPPALEVSRDPVSPSPVSGSAAAPVAPSGVVAPLTPGRYVQLGAYQSRSSAQAAMERLRGQPGGLPEVVSVRQDGAFFKLVAGPYSQPAQAQEAQRRLRAATGIDVFQLVR